MTTASLLVELFVEELPPKALKTLGESFAQTLAASLKAQGLASADAVATPFASPRRLALHLTDVRARADDRAVTHKLMPASVGLDGDGRPTAALAKKLAGLGLDLDGGAAGALERRGEGKAETLFIATVEPGATLAEGLQKALDDAIAKLPIPKTMSYQLADGWTTVNFVRPAHGLVALHGDAVVRCDALGLTAGRTTRGHRFEALHPTIELRDADGYADQLRDEGAVIAGFDTRRAEIARQIDAAAAAAGAAPVDDAALLDEVTALVERPNVLIGRFDEAFLGVPQECLILTMKANQKYFPLLDAAGRLTNRFLLVSNITPADPGRVVEGNERVVRPRLADAKFFYDQDRRRTLASRVAGLDKVVYHGKLGSQGERVERVRRIARWTAQRIGADVDLADRAAFLAKADLLTDMVGEFPELQGVMGGYYAANDGEPPEVAAAIADQYATRRDDTEDGESLVTDALLIADRAETLVGMWAVGAKPTGDKDPYAIRRNALGLIRAFETIAAVAAFQHREVELDLRELLLFVAGTFESGVGAPAAVDPVEAFILERHANRMMLNYSAKEVDAVFALRPPLHVVEGRLAAVHAFAALPEAAALAAANKRVGNILKKSEVPPPAQIDVALLVEPAEVALAAALREAEPPSRAAFERGDFAASLSELATLRTPVDAFFDAVMVNAEDPALRANRLGLLATLHAAMNRVADLSKLAA